MDDSKYFSNFESDLKTYIHKQTSLKHNELRQRFISSDKTMNYFHDAVSRILKNREPVRLESLPGIVSQVDYFKEKVEEKYKLNSIRFSQDFGYLMYNHKGTVSSKEVCEKKHDDIRKQIFYYRKGIVENHTIFTDENIYERIQHVAHQTKLDLTFDSLETAADEIDQYYNNQMITIDVERTVDTVLSMAVLEEEFEQLDDVVDRCLNT